MGEDVTREDAEGPSSEEQHQRATEDGTEIEVNEGAPSSGMSVEITTDSSDERVQEPGLVRSRQPGSKSSDFEQVN
jgi:hypothetical protein